MRRMDGTLQCVLCHTRPVDTRWRPFCSERCRNADLAHWVDGTYRAPIDTATDDTPTDDDSGR
jgi:endogenous inhibitor of DNA gyrase (YacG/DUF329 family)